MNRFPDGHVFFAGGCVALTLLLGGCDDASIDPIAMAVAPETHGAVLLTGGLPTVSDLLLEHGLAARMQEDLDAWWGSWDLGLPEGASARAAIYPVASSALFPFLLDEGVAELLSRNEADLKAAQAVELLLVAHAVDTAMTRAWQYHRQAVAALGGGRGELALGLALRSADAVREVSPEQVARALLQDAADALRRNDGLVTYSEEELTRIQRLTRGAEEALAAGDYPRAIRRAYYACQLLGVGPG